MFYYGLLGKSGKMLCSSVLQFPLLPMGIITPQGGPCVLHWLRPSCEGAVSQDPPLSRRARKIGPPQHVPLLLLVHYKGSGYEGTLKFYELKDIINVVLNT